MQAIRTARRMPGICYLTLRHLQRHRNFSGWILRIKPCDSDVQHESVCNSLNPNDANRESQHRQQGDQDYCVSLSHFEPRTRKYSCWLFMFVAPRSHEGLRNPIIWGSLKVSDNHECNARRLTMPPSASDNGCTTMNAASSRSLTTVLIRPISRRVTTQKRMSWSALLRPPRPL